MEVGGSSGGAGWEAVTLRTVALPIIVFWTFGHHHVDFAMGSCTMHHDDRDCEGVFGVSDTANIIGSG